MKLELALDGGGGRWVGPKRTAAADKLFSLHISPTKVQTAGPKKKEKEMASPSHIRSLYRSILREIPHRPLSTPSPIQQRIRNSFNSPSDRSNHDAKAAQQQEVAEEAEQYLQYARAQRMYSTLLERYNPGIGSVMDEDERTRLTARRVGINLPEEYSQS